MHENISKTISISHTGLSKTYDRVYKADSLIPLLRQIALIIKNAGLKIDEYAVNLRIIQAIARMLSNGVDRVISETS